MRQSSQRKRSAWRREIRDSAYRTPQPPHCPADYTTGGEGQVLFTGGRFLDASQRRPLYFGADYGSDNNEGRTKWRRDGRRAPQNGEGAQLKLAATKAKATAQNNNNAIKFKSKGKGAADREFLKGMSSWNLNRWTNLNSAEKSWVKSRRWG
jgi:hypothetical protein